MQYQNKIRNTTALVFVLIMAACNGGTDADAPGDTSNVQDIDTTEGVVNPGMGDTTNVVTPPATNDNNAIMPDSTIVNQ